MKTDWHDEVKRIDDLYEIRFHSDDGEVWEAYTKAIPNLTAEASSPITALEMLVIGVHDWERVHGSKDNG